MVTTGPLPGLMGLGLRLSPQSPAPSTYSLTEESRMVMDAFLADGQTAQVKVYRSGPKEVAEVTAPSPKGTPGAVHTRYLFDFQSHKVYIDNLAHSTCSWMRYVSDGPPSNYDPLASATATQMAESTKQNPKILGKERERHPRHRAGNLFAGGGTSQVWVAEKGHFPVKLAMTGADGKATVMLEVKEVSFSQPPDSVFVPPANCATQTQGEMSDTGVSAHFEANIEAHGSGSVDLATNKSQGQASASMRTSSSATTSATSAGTASGAQAVLGASSPNSPKVTEVHLHLVPDHYNGPCPGHVQLVGEIYDRRARDRLVPVSRRSRGRLSEGTVTFTEAGTRTVTMDGTFRMTPRVPGTALLAITTDAEGKPGPLTRSSGNVNHNITCTAAQ